MPRVALRLILGLAALSLLPISASSAKSPKKMAILPFTMNTDRDLSFLQEGIVDMLASRLAWKGELEVLEKGIVRSEVSNYKGPLNRETAIAIGKRLQVDYVILGSLTVFGDSVSVDARILDVANSDELVTAFNQAKGMDEVIPTVTQFAQDINEKVMGRVVGTPVQRAEGGEGPRSPGGLVAEGQHFEGKGVNHTQGVRAEIVSLDIGDVDGDGKNELVLVDKDTVYVQKWKEKGFTPLKAVKEKWATNFIWVSVADLNGNGRGEIYVCNLGQSDVSSFVLEWEGNDFRKIGGKQPWLLRVIDMPGKGRTLIGQKREIDGVFHGGVQLLQWEGTNLVSAGVLPLHKFANVFNFALLDAGTGQETVLLDTADKLRLYDEKQEEVWRSDEPFSGTYTYIPKKLQERGEDRTFLPTPIIITDVDDDGTKEIMVCKNFSSIGRLLANLRDYSSGTLYFLVRDGTGLSTKWTTKKLGGAMVGYKVGDVDGDGLPELILATVMREDRAFGNPRSRLVVYDLK